MLEHSMYQGAEREGLREGLSPVERNLEVLNRLRATEAYYFVVRSADFGAPSGVEYWLEKIHRLPEEVKAGFTPDQQKLLADALERAKDNLTKVTRGWLEGERSKAYGNIIDNVDGEFSNFLYHLARYNIPLSEAELEELQKIRWQVRRNLIEAHLERAKESEKAGRIDLLFWSVSRLEKLTKDPLAEFAPEERKELERLKEVTISMKLKNLKDQVDSATEIDLLDFYQQINNLRESQREARIYLKQHHFEIVRSLEQSARERGSWSSCIKKLQSCCELGRVKEAEEIIYQMGKIADYLRIDFPTVTLDGETVADFVSLRKLIKNNAMRRLIKQTESHAEKGSVEDVDGRVHQILGLFIFGPYHDVPSLGDRYHSSVSCGLQERLYNLRIQARKVALGRLDEELLNLEREIDENLERILNSESLNAVQISANAAYETQRKVETYRNYQADIKEELSPEKEKWLETLKLKSMIVSIVEEFQTLADKARKSYPRHASCARDNIISWLNELRERLKIQALPKDVAPVAQKIIEELNEDMIDAELIWAKRERLGELLNLVKDPESLIKRDPLYVEGVVKEIFWLANDTEVALTEDDERALLNLHNKRVEGGYCIEPIFDFGYREDMVHSVISWLD